MQARALVERAEAAKGPAPAEPRTAQTRKPAPRLGLGIEDAAEAIGVSADFFHEHVKPDLRITRRGRRQIVAVRELERWLEESAARAYEPPRRGD